MIDWLTLRTDALSDHAISVLKPVFAQTMMVKNDEILWQSPVRENIRSDSHQISVYLSGAFEIGGSPARVGQFNNVFGSSDPSECARRMIAFVEKTFEIELPPIEQWRCSRIDATFNYDMGSEDNVFQALEYLSHASDGRIKPTNDGPTVYWNKRSSYQAGKAYGKGEHLHYQTCKGQAFASLKEIHHARRLLRLELVNRSKFLKRYLEQVGKEWYELTAVDLHQLHDNYFSRLIPEVEVIVMDRENVIQALIDANECTERQAKSAYTTYCTAKALGKQHVARSMSLRTFQRHTAMLSKVGIKAADLSRADVRPLRKKALILSEPVRDWEHLYLLAKAA